MPNKKIVKNPMQPMVTDSTGMVRFKANKIVRFLLDWSISRGMSLNELAIIDFSRDDREQLAQLIGYCIGGFSELPYVRDETYQRAAELAAPLIAKRRKRKGK